MQPGTVLFTLSIICATLLILLAPSTQCLLFGLACMIAGAFLMHEYNR